MTLNKFFDLTFVLSILFGIFFTISYFFYFDDLCDNYSGKNENEMGLSLYKLAKCKDSPICELSDIGDTKGTVVTTWTCEKQKISILSADFYIEQLNNLIK